MSLKTFTRAYPKVVLSAADQAKMAAIPPWLLSMLLMVIKFMGGNLDAILALLSQWITLKPETIALIRWLIDLLVKTPAPPGPAPA